ncbi:methionine adenosyltransferase [Candidatus Kaiserbacteria bacterium RIFCSPHIGHO2_01_FULL_54_36]|uniref:Methionine adenosyltransferase n=1 Tax=Candidatus Kaiserbacteria bacterium RIFCSPHIGHO2_01_FULL_54_36 TaxID=1798482 RepID=A0A1F6CKA5_9BACT|nr:MAG: methionine adenosyltransferase [Candidatus Kaiserbacteria bacterium RIFCSPHIGHO2_01_FULL_54_36]OGG75393.1 MAG: methionine adenosyltransferase [Candidatus Kaiserbacteria bacterium RIFCSPLOWO2_01_FULL_54_22]
MFHSLERYTVESVTSGHPDKVCDQISDAILDACLKQDRYSRVAVESFGSHGTLILGGEVKTRAKVDFERIARKVYRDIGYTDTLKVLNTIAKQSPDIAMGVDTGGAGDQGIMYGYATNETKEMLPLGVVLCHALARRLEKLRRDKTLKWLKPDGKTQVTISNGKVITALCSTQHDKKVSQEEIRKQLIKHLFTPILGNLKNIEILVNPTGQFILGGFTADAGLTGRKIMVDTYGGVMPHGGGAFSGKDATKVDRSAAYMCRFVAKNLVANGYAKKALVSVAYAIGRVEPVMIEAFDEKGKNLTKIVNEHFDFRPRAIIKRLGLNRPIFQATAAYGHFGVAGRPWEKIVKI